MYNYLLILPTYGGQDCKYCADLEGNTKWETEANIYKTTTHTD